MTDYGARLFDQHAAMLAASAITPEHARARGYVSVDTKIRLEQLGVTKAGRNVPGLLVPMRDKAGEVWGYQYRPDGPRLNGTGKPVKYETPTGQRNGIDVPPGVGPSLDDPQIPLWITEGSKKADAAVCAGLACIALAGVWSWRGTNSSSGKAAVADWHDIALNGRPVVLAFDSDVVRKRAVRQALTQFAAYLASKGAAVRYLHPPHTDDGKTGLDDYLAGHTVDELHTLVRPEPPEVVDAAPSPPETGATPQHPKSSGMPSVAVLRRILDGVGDEVRVRGLVGEERLAQTLYLVLTSRLLDKQVSAGVKGHSASGKSYAVETITRFFPPEAYLEFTAMSERALVYSPEQYSHRTLIVYEVVALREGVEDDMTSYFVRSLLSEGRINYPVTVRDKDGGFTTKTIIKEGPTNLIFTTTKTRVHAENETRILSLGTDDSREQTARVLLELADEGQGGDDLSEWQDLQRWLTGAEHRVTIPYAKALVEKIPPVAVRLRRDVGSLLALIRSHAVLHQATRQKDQAGRIVADLDDYAVVRDLVADVMAEGVGATVSETVRETVEAVAAIAPPNGIELRALADRLKLDKSNVSRRLARAADGGYVRNLEDKRGKPGRWVIGDPLPEAADLLPDPEKLRNTATPDQPLDKDRRGVAPDSDREGEPTEPPATTCTDWAACQNSNCRVFRACVRAA